MFIPNSMSLLVKRGILIAVSGVAPVITLEAIRLFPPPLSLFGGCIGVALIITPGASGLFPLRYLLSEKASRFGVTFMITW